MKLIKIHIYLFKIMSELAQNGEIQPDNADENNQMGEIQNQNE